MHTTEKTIEEREYNGKTVKLSNLDKVFWTKEAYTKGDLIHYYETISEYILPYLKDKPLTLFRNPDGADQPGFFQKDMDLNHLPNWIKTVQIKAESTQKTLNYLICNDKASLIYMINMGCIEINPWLSTHLKPQYPEFMVLDLDPGENTFKEVVDVALVGKAILDKMNIQSFIKTSGSTGLHIYVYLAQAYNYDTVKEFAKVLANQIHNKIPELTSLHRSPNKRKNLIYIDFLQNARGQTIAAPYSVRPKPGATVSMPLNWKDVHNNLDFHDFTILSVPQIIKERVDPWQAIMHSRAEIPNELHELYTDLIQITT